MERTRKIIPEEEKQKILSLSWKICKIHNHPRKKQSKVRITMRRTKKKTTDQNKDKFTLTCFGWCEKDWGGGATREKRVDKMSITCF